MSVAALLTETCTIQRKTETVDDDTGFPKAAWAETYATSVPCLIQAVGSSESRFGMRETGEVFYTGFFAWGQDIVTGDKVSWTPTGGSAKVLMVVGPPRDPAGRQSHYEVPLQEIQGGGQS